MFGFRAGAGGSAEIWTFSGFINLDGTLNNPENTETLDHRIWTDAGFQKYNSSK